MRKNILTTGKKRLLPLVEDMTAAWGKITAGEIISPIQGECASGSTETVFKGLSTDSRKIQKGELFLALKGDRFDGHDYIDQALKNGAAGIIREGTHTGQVINDAVVITVPDTLKALGDLAGWWRHQHKVQIAAITGSAGKTTTKEIASRILELGSGTLKNPGNLNNLIGMPLTLLDLEKKHHRAVLEMGMNQPGEIARLTEIADPDIGLITNVAKAHLEGLGDIKGVAKAKTELIEKISSEGTIVLNGDDQLLMETASRFNRKTTTYGFGRDNHIRAEMISDTGHGGTSFNLIYRGHSAPARLRVPGKHTLHNALAASAIALCLEEPIDNIVKGLENFEGIKGRFMINHLSGGILLIDDTYNSNPFSLRASLESAKELAAGSRRMIVGLGEMLELGSETVSAHHEAGAMVAEAGASHLFAFGDHAEEMVKGALAEGLSPGNAVIVKSRDEMKSAIKGTLEEGDLVLLKGSRMMALDKVSDALKENQVKERHHVCSKKDFDSR